MKKSNYIDNLIKYFDSIKQGRLFMYTNINQEYTNQTNMMLMILSAFLTFYIILISFSNPFISSMINSQNLILIPSLNGRVTQIESLNVSSKLLNSTDSMLFLEKIEQSYRMVGFILLMIVITLLAFLFCIFWLQNKKIKKVNQVVTELGSIALILNILYLLKIKWGDKIDNPKIKQKLIKFHLPFNEYIINLKKIVNVLEKSDEKTKN